ncbi:MAG: LysM peptidoglycan-binding domain-containing protein [Acidiferrobacterales bacterium]
MVKRIHFFIVAALAVTPAVFAKDPASFPRPPELEPDIRFWTRVYTEVDTQGGFIHDARQLDVVYEVIHFTSGSSNRSKRRRVREVKKHYRDILLVLARGKRQDLSSEERRVLAFWPEDVDKRALRSAARRLRFQLGQADKFRAGLIRAGAWAQHIRQTLSEMGLPTELVALPHVESSYDPTAYSRVGAAGLWQFTRSTGRRYLRIDGAVDERMDPFVSTVAAARLLKHNHAVTGSWPLAITAYNHGAAGMRRAVRKLGTQDITTIVRRYKSRIFGFASRNFYVAFLAALDVHANAEKYFGPLRQENPIDTEIVTVSAYTTVDSLERALGVDRATLRRHNPGLRPAVWRGTKYVPRGYALRVPRPATGESAVAAVARIPVLERYQTQKPDRFYKVRRGDTLAGIAVRFGVSVNELARFNGLHNRNRIRAGQVLRLPLPGVGTKTVLTSATTVRPHATSSPMNSLYTVQPGDTLSVIARRFGVDEQDLASANELLDKNRIHAGQVLRVALARSEAVEAIASRPPAVDAERTATPADMTDSEIANVESAEPTSAEEAESIAPTLPPSAHPALAADPSDYSVGSGQTIEVQAAETLGHYAEWLELRAARLRAINNMSYREPVVIGGRLRLDFSRVSIETFEQRRLAYHRSLQEAFFMQFQITGTQAHVVKRGDSLWLLSQDKYDVPIWLLRQYNPDLDFNAVLPGTTVTIPRLQPRGEENRPSAPIPWRTS